METTKTTDRTTSGLCDALFEEFDLLRNGMSDASRAAAISKLAVQIINTKRLEIDAAGFAKSGLKFVPLALTARECKLVPLINDPRVIDALGVIENARRERRETKSSGGRCLLCGATGAKFNKHHRGYGPFCQKHLSGWGTALFRSRPSSTEETELAFALFLARRLKDEATTKNACRSE